MSQLTLTTLLNSLHTHLQTQTQLLPTLHAQLGLPQTALEDELKALQHNLMQSVENQIQVRQKEVDAWADKCANLENECVRYTKALGGNTKATGLSVGELRKEQVLPMRFERIGEFQEKLRQLYHTKLEQLTTLTNRLTTLSNTLGPDFYQPDITEPTVANGESSVDPTSNRDVTPERFSKLEKELVRGKSEVTKRLTQLSATLVQIDWLYTELGIVPHSPDSLPAASILRPSSSCSNNASSSSSDPFLSTSMSTPTPASRVKPSSITPLIFTTPENADADCQRIFARFVAAIEATDTSPADNGSAVPIGLEGVEPTPELISWASSTRASLEETKRRRETHIQAMYDQLEGLWKRLNVAERDMDGFVEAHRGSTDETVAAYEEELERMMELKRERMSVFVASAREEIVRLWEELMVGDEERSDFAPFADDEHTEELLTIHEDEIKRLKEERRMKAPLLANIKKYFNICEEQKELAAAASDQTRLLGRGSRDPGRLLREEKMRKRVSKEKPRLEQDLLTMIPQWEDETGRQFLVHGESILDILTETVGIAEQENKRKHTRAGSVPVRATTPVSNSGHYVPGNSRSGVVTPAVRSASSMASSSHSVPNKRQRTGEGTASSSSHGRPPMGPCRVQSNVRAVSPTKGGKTPVGSSLPRPVNTMSIPNPSTQHHALGHGRIPSSVYSSQGQQRSTSSNVPSVTTSSVYRRDVNSGSGSVYGRSVVALKATRARRESFKPRPSVESGGLDSHGHVPIVSVSRWGGFGPAVQEEDE